MAYLEMFTGWDYVLVLIAIMSFGLGVFRGMVKTVFDLSSWVGAFILAPMLSTKISAFAGLQAYPWVGLLIGFVGAFFAIRLLGVILARGLNSVGLAGADRALGGAVGLARAALIVLVLSTTGFLLEMHKQPAWQQAVSRPVLDWCSSTVIQYFPDLQKLKPARIRAVG